MKMLIQLALFCLLCNTAFAQTATDPSMRDLQEELRQMRLRLLEQMERMSPGSGSAWKWDTTFQLQLDTMYDDGPFSRHFFYSPPNKDSLGIKGFDLFGGGDNPLENMFQWFFDAPSNDENSALENADDGLLPEERLRKDPPAQGNKIPLEKPAPAEHKKSNIKTIRI